MSSHAASPPRGDRTAVPRRLEKTLKHERRDWVVIGKAASTAPAPARRLSEKEADQEKAEPGEHDRGEEADIERS